MRPDLEELRRLLAAYPNEEWDAAPTYPNDVNSWIWAKTHHAVGDPDAPDTRFGEALSGRAALIAAMRNTMPALLREAEAARKLRERIACNCGVCFSCVAASEYDAAVGVK